jgi:hypothetical protein
MAEDEGAPAHPPSAAPPRPPSAADVALIVREQGEKAAAAEASAQGSAGGGSEQAAAAQAEEGAIARGTHLATDDMQQSVASVRAKAGKKDKKDSMSITEMARRVKSWGIAKPARAKHSAWKWGFKYATPPPGPGGYKNQALCALCCVNDLGNATVKLGTDASPSALMTHLQHSHPAEYQLCYEMEKARKEPKEASRVSPRKRAASSQVPSGQGQKFVYVVLI